MMIHDVTGAAGHRERRKRVGRGESSGMGKTCGRGGKGCQSRSGYHRRLVSEGGQMPIFRRLPKRGFSNFNFQTECAVLNVADLERHFDAGTVVDVEMLKKARLIPGIAPRIKLLGAGHLTKKLTVEAHACSAQAKAAVEQAGGSVRLLAQRDSAAQWKAKRNSVKRLRQAKAATKGS